MDKLALIFPGQGSQKRGMGKELCSHFPVASRLFEEASDTLGLDMKKLCFESPASELTKTENAQPAILTLSVAKYKVFNQEIGIEPSFLAGHSLGEYSALVAGNSLKFRDAVRVVRKRGELMSRSRAGNMAAISGAAPERVRVVCEKCSSETQTVTAANYNSSSQIVISGSKDAVKKAAAELATEGVTITPLRVSAAFHSPLMADAAEEFNTFLQDFEFSFPSVSLISNCTAEPYRNGREIRGKLVEQITSPVLWHQSVQFMTRAGANTFVELGPGSTLNNMLKREQSNLKLYSSSTKEDLLMLQELTTENFTSTIPGIPERCMAMAVCTKNRNRNSDEYHQGVVLPYKELKALCFDLKDRKQEADKDQMDRALNILQTIFETKKVPADEQNRRFRKLIEETETEHLYPQYS